ncbi:MAG: AAA family ATPase [Crenarchaeota archaeon]|nr:AAA family ATPase [Thermoproteota archaeon]
MERVPTGIKYLDDVLGGGLPKSSSILLAGNPGAGKTTFGATFLYRGAIDFGEPGLYVSFVEDKRSFLNYMSTLGMDFDKLEREGLFAFMGVPYVDISRSLETIVFRILQLAREKGIKRVVIDSVSAIAQALRSQERVRAFLHNTFIYGLKKAGDVTTILVADLPYGATTIGLGVEEFVVDGVLVLKVERLKGLVLRYLEVWKMRGVEVGRSIIPFTIGKGGFIPVLFTRCFNNHSGVSALSPLTTTLRRLFTAIPTGATILVAGPPGSGKSMLVSELALNAAIQGFNVLYVSLEERESSVRSRMSYIAKKCFGRTTPEVVENIHVVSIDPYQYEITDVCSYIMRLIAKIDPLVIVLDGSDALEPLTESSAFLSIVRSFVESVRRFGRIAIVTKSSAVGMPKIKRGFDGLADILISTTHDRKSPGRRLVHVLKTRIGFVKEFSAVIGIG